MLVSIAFPIVEVALPSSPLPFLFSFLFPFLYFFNLRLLFFYLYRAVFDLHCSICFCLPFSSAQQPLLLDPVGLYEAFFFYARSYTSWPLFHALLGSVCDCIYLLQTILRIVHTSSHYPFTSSPSCLLKKVHFYIYFSKKNPSKTMILVEPTFLM